MNETNASKKRSDLYGSANVLQSAYLAKYLSLDQVQDSSTAITWPMHSNQSEMNLGISSIPAWRQEEQTAKGWE